jgi:flagellar biosynthesis/type III secretory pathway protein FliH
VNPAPLQPWLALHRGGHTSLATQQLFLQADELSQAHQALALLQRLEALASERGAELLAAREQAQAEGHAAGLLAGRAEALARTAPQLWAAWEQTSQTSAQALATLRSQVVDLALQVVRHISQDMGPAATVAALAGKAVLQLLPDSATTVHVHPEVAAAVGQRVGASPGVLDVRADPQLPLHGCRLHSAAGERVADLDQQLHRLATALADVAPAAD